MGNPWRLARANVGCGWDNGVTTQDGPGSVGALWFRGLADDRSVD